MLLLSDFEVFLAPLQLDQYTDGFVKAFETLPKLLAHSSADINAIIDDNEALGDMTGKEKRRLKGAMEKTDDAGLRESFALALSRHYTIL